MSQLTPTRPAVRRPGGGVGFGFRVAALGNAEITKLEMIEIRVCKSRDCAFQTSVCTRWIDSFGGALHEPHTVLDPPRTVSRS